MGMTDTQEQIAEEQLTWNGAEAEAEANNVEQISTFEKLIQDAKESNHTDAILLLNEKKPEIQKNVVDILKSLWEKEKVPDVIRKAFGILAEYVFSSCVDILVKDRKYNG